MPAPFPTIRTVEQAAVGSRLPAAEVVYRVRSPDFIGPANVLQSRLGAKLRELRRSSLLEAMLSFVWYDPCWVSLAWGWLAKLGSLPAYLFDNAIQMFFGGPQ